MHRKSGPFYFNGLCIIEFVYCSGLGIPRHTCFFSITHATVLRPFDLCRLARRSPTSAPPISSPSAQLETQGDKVGAGLQELQHRRENGTFLSNEKITHDTLNMSVKRIRPAPCHARRDMPHGSWARRKYKGDEAIRAEEGKMS